MNNNSLLFSDAKVDIAMLVRVRRLPTQSRWRHFGGVSEEKTRSDHVTRKALDARNNEAYAMDKATADSLISVQSFAIIKNTGHGNFVIGLF